jgi:X-Pro dipeptidyl-peptidase (S15 family)
VRSIKLATAIIVDVFNFLARLSHTIGSAVTASETHPVKFWLLSSIALVYLHTFMLYSSHIENSCQQRKNFEEGTMTQSVAGIEPGQRQLNGPQTTGRDYRNLSEPEYEMMREVDLAVPTRDGTILQADVYRPVAEGQFPVLIAASVYPRQIQDIGAPMGFIEAGASDFFVPRGYVHVIANVRGTGGSGGTYTLFDQTEREDLYDLVEWAAAQPWSDGNVGMIGISYFAMTQLEAASERPPHLKAIFPLEVSTDLYQTVWHNGLLNIHQSMAERYCYCSRSRVKIVEG